MSYPKLSLLKLLFTICILCYILSCSDDNKPQTIGIFEIAETHLIQNVKQEETLITIPVKTNLSIEEWAMESGADWCVAAKSVNGESIKLSVKASGEVDVRNTEVTVKSSLNSYIIKINQLGYGPAILLKDEKVTIGSEGGEVGVVVTTNIKYNYNLSESSEWVTAQASARGMEEYNHRFHVIANPGYADREAILTFTGKTVTEVTAECHIIQEAKPSGVSDVESEGDILIKPTGGIASQWQPGSGIEHTFDGKTDTDPHYHSLWNNAYDFPITLEYTFSGENIIDYFIYHTRSGNGNFGKFKVYTATAEETEYLLQGEFDFKMRNNASKTALEKPVKATRVKFEILSGLSGFASCAEMQFFSKSTDNKLENQLLAVFTDLSCTEVRTEISDKEINSLPGYFARIAVELRDNRYNEFEKPFRIRDYAPYSDVEEWSKKNVTKKYSNLDNPTGIYAEKNDSIVVLIGDTHGCNISLQSISGTETDGDTYFLREGVNKIGIQNTGMLFIMYTADLGLPAAKPIRIHIPPGSGMVDGFFDLKEHKTDQVYAELINKAKYKYFIVRGECILFNFERSILRETAPIGILSAIELWDNIIRWEHEIMGIDDLYPAKFNNHLRAITIAPEDGFMWASDYRIAFAYTTLHNILMYESVIKARDNIWGPAHEIGHLHQRAINWPGCSESSNNLFSNYAVYKLGKFCSRGSELSELARVRFVEKLPWCIFTGNPDEEHTELHMRMNWQLWCYYHGCGYNTNFFPTLFKLLREDRLENCDAGTAQLKYAKLASQAANEDLSDFFEMWGFLQPVDAVIDQYGKFTYKVTEGMIQSARNYMSKFPAPKHAFYYLEDRRTGDPGAEDYQLGNIGHISQFKKPGQITKNITYSISGQSVAINNGDEAVAFEIRKQGKIIYFSNSYIFNVPTSIPINGADIYAVQADGKRIILKKQ